MKLLIRCCLQGLGILVEGCSGHYAMQEFQTELDARQQQKVARRMIYTLIKEIMPLFKRGLVAFAGGNHGENRKKWKKLSQILGIMQM